MGRNRCPPSRRSRSTHWCIPAEVERNRLRRGAEDDRSRIAAIPLAPQTLVALVSYRQLARVRAALALHDLIGLSIEQVCALTWADLSRLQRLITRERCRAGIR